MSEVETPPQYVQLPFFDFPDRPAKREKTKAQVARALIPSWRKYVLVTRRQCDPCVAEAFTADRAGQLPPIPRHARHIRTVAGKETFMCDTHAEPIQKADAAVKAAKKAKAKQSVRKGRR